MRLVRKLFAFVALVAVAGVLAAAYGALHDQLSYTVAPEYYTRFKFMQFAWVGVGDMAPRVGAAVVGVLATWWVGVYAGLVVAGAVLVHRTAREMVRSTLRAYVLLALVAACAGLFGLAVGWVAFGSDAVTRYVDWWRPAGLIAPRRFFAAGMMHDASYLGGAIGMVAAVRYQLRAALGLRHTPAPDASGLTPGAV